MAEYMPLTTNSPNELDDDDELKPLKGGGGKFSHESNRLDVKHRTALVWFTILMAVTAIAAAATLPISILSAISRLAPLRSPNDITSTLTIVKPYTNLQKGRAIMTQKGMNSKSR